MVQPKKSTTFLTDSVIMVAFFLVLLGCVMVFVYCGGNGISGHTWVWGFLIAVFSVVIALMIFVLSVFAVQEAEHSKLFQPTLVKQYPSTFKGRWYNLKHGGGLMNTTPTRNSASIRRVLFLHGNSYDLSKYQPALITLENLGYDVWAIEYAGFGKANAQSNTDTNKPNSESCLQDVMDAWSICGRSDAIVIGFSLGGAILGEVYDALSPSPAQLVFLNTFASFPQLVADKLGTSIANPFLHTQWETQPPKRYQGKVTVVYTLDDTVVPPSHGKRICKIFSKLNTQCIALQSGGHRYSALNHRDEWANGTTLLSPRLL